MGSIPKPKISFHRNSNNKDINSYSHSSDIDKSRSTDNNFSSLSFNIIIVSTITVSAISWIIAFAGSIAASQEIDYFPKFTWWGLVFELFVIIAIPVLYFLNLLTLYKNFLISVIAIAFIYTSNSTNNLVYYTNSSCSAAGTGFILLSISNFLWLFYLGSEPNAPLISTINRYGGPTSNQISRKRISSMNTRSNTYAYTPGTQSTTRLNFENAKIPNNNNIYNNNNNNNDDQYSNMEDAHELAGFENPTTGTPSNMMSNLEFNDSAFRASGIIQPGNGNSLTAIDNNQEGTNFTGISSATAYIEDYPILVRGLYDYIASPDDVNELSFAKGEVFRVKNTNGNWWQGKNKHGEIGMCPSNYLEVVI